MGFEPALPRGHLLIIVTNIWERLWLFGNVMWEGGIRSQLSQPKPLQETNTLTPPPILPPKSPKPSQFLMSYFLLNVANPSTNNSTSGIRRRINTLHILTCNTMQGCGWISSVVCINVKTRDRWEGNVTTHSEIWTYNFNFLGFWGIREGVTHQRLILQSLGYTSLTSIKKCP